MCALNNCSYDLMIAEDDDDDYFFFTMAIKEIPYLVKMTRAINGELLMKLLQDHVPDILFLDLHMPCKDGYQCIEEIRANHRYDNLPIIVYSSRNDSPSIDKCYRTGSNFFAAKPVTVGGVKSIIQKALDMNWNGQVHYPTRDNFLLQPQKPN